MLTKKEKFLIIYYHKPVLAWFLPLQIQRSGNKRHEAREAVWVFWENSRKGSTIEARFRRYRRRLYSAVHLLKKSSNRCATHQTYITHGWRPLRMPIMPSFSLRFTAAPSAAKPSNFFSNDSSEMPIVWKLSFMQLTMPAALPFLTSASLGMCHRLSKIILIKFYFSSSKGQFKKIWTFSTTGATMLTVKRRLRNKRKVLTHFWKVLVVRLAKISNSFPLYTRFHWKRSMFQVLAQTNW